MKSIRLVLVIFLVIKFAYLPAQLSLNLGNDTTYCANYLSDWELGSNMLIQNGKPPFSFKWSCEYKFGRNTYYASDFLNDTTHMYPNFKETNANGVWFMFTLEIVDSAGEKAIDSINVRFSYFSYLSLEYEFTIERGDSVYLQGGFVYPGIPPLTYYWTPTRYLTEPEKSNTWSVPDSSITYFEYAVDSVGCQSYEWRAINIIVSQPNSLSEQLQIEETIQRHGDHLYLPIKDGEFAKIYFYDLRGRLIKVFDTTSSILDLSSMALKNDSYIVLVIVNRKTYSFKL